MKKPAVIVLTALLLLSLSFIGYRIIFKKRQESEVLPAKILLHKSDNTSVVVDSSDSNYQKIVDKTNKIISTSILVPREKQVLVTLLVDPITFPKEMEQSDYIDTEPQQLFIVPGQESEYNLIRFVLSGGYGGIIFLHAVTPHEYWGAWSPLDTNIFWSLGEFLPILTPTPQTTSPSLHKITSPPLRETNKEEVLQKLGIKATGFYREYTTRPDSFDPDQLALYPEVCRKGGYDLFTYLHQDLTFTGYRTDVVYQFTRGMENEVMKEEPLNVWVISSDNKIVCIYLSVREDSTMAPGIFSVNDPLFKLPSK